MWELFIQAGPVGRLVSDQHGCTRLRPVHRQLGHQHSIDCLCPGRLGVSTVQPGYPYAGWLETVQLNVWLLMFVGHMSVDTDIVWGAGEGACSRLPTLLISCHASSSSACRARRLVSDPSSGLEKERQDLSQQVERTAQAVGLVCSGGRGSACSDSNTHRSSVLCWRAVLCWCVAAAVNVCLPMDRGNNNNLKVALTKRAVLVCCCCAAAQPLCSKRVPAEGPGHQQPPGLWLCGVQGRGGCRLRKWYPLNPSLLTYVASLNPSLM